MMLLRHLLAILLLPFMVVIVIPYGLLSATTFSTGDIAARWGDSSPLEWAARLLGMIVFALGFGLFCWCVALFVKVGRGTLAPWDPTQALVAAGPYKYVRNPMISGVVAMLFGQALFWGSWAVAFWTATVLLINHMYFVAIEEPGLEERFGTNYTNYKARVPRWIPKW